MREEVKPEDQKRKISRFEEPTLTFENALYLHIEKQDYKKARALYLRAIQRALFPWPAFSMLLNVHLLHAHSKEHLENKIKDLKLTYGPFLSIHSDFQSHLDRCLRYSKIMEEDPRWQLKQNNFQESQAMMFGKTLMRNTSSFCKEILVLKVQMESIYAEDIRNSQQIFEKKKEILELFNYDPFIEQIHLVNGVF